MLACTKALFHQICRLKVALPNFVKNFVYQTFRPYFKTFNCHFLSLGRKDSTVLPITHCNLTLLSNKQVTYYVISTVMNVVSGVVQKPVNCEVWWRFLRISRSRIFRIHFNEIIFTSGAGLWCTLLYCGSNHKFLDIM